jgi:hypothetical protein
MQYLILLHGAETILLRGKFEILTHNYKENGRNKQSSDQFITTNCTVFT